MDKVKEKMKKGFDPQIDIAWWGWFARLDAIYDYHYDVHNFRWSVVLTISSSFRFR